MRTCQTCGNEYDRSFIIEMHDKAFEFDRFECAIQMLAPTCHHRQTKIIGHGVQKGDYIYCCTHCARLDGYHELQDRHGPQSMIV